MQNTEDKMEGYTQEEMEAIAELMGLGTSVKNVWVHTEPMTPEYRLKLIEGYRKALQARKKHGDE
jgi:hypothetical protein